jgi:hypothetical protein
MGRRPPDGGFQRRRHPSPQYPQRTQRQRLTHPCTSRPAHHRRVGRRGLHPRRRWHRHRLPPSPSELEPNANMTAAPSMTTIARAPQTPLLRPVGSIYPAERCWRHQGRRPTRPTPPARQRRAVSFLVAQQFSSLSPPPACFPPPPWPLCAAATADRRRLRPSAGGVTGSSVGGDASSSAPISSASASTSSPSPSCSATRRWIRPGSTPCPPTATSTTPATGSWSTADKRA